MSYETRMTRQNLPQSTLYVDNSSLVGKLVPLAGQQMRMIPPELGGEWRFREMMMLPAIEIETEAGYSVPSSSVTGAVGYTVPPKFKPSPTEVLIVWERYREAS